jgi:hypothetical protein
MIIELLAVAQLPVRKCGDLPENRRCPNIFACAETLDET